jgi:2-dehydro-3-deoxyphosphogluconate aldolase / (4S)-4-hydroxy-2-oxoglutarate aldolase
VGVDFEQLVGAVRVIPVVETPRPEAAVPLARALAEAGLPCAEITFRTAGAADAIAAIAAEVPDFLVGAGTVLTLEQAEEATTAGAAFLVSPGLDAGLVRFAQHRGVAVLPGVCTPTEIMAALALGVSVVKLFPAEASGGVGYLKAVAAAFRRVRFVPTGGVGPGNLAAYLALPQVAACGGSWMVAKQLIAAGDYDRIRELTAEAVALAEAARPEVAGAAGPAAAARPAVTS